MRQQARGVGRYTPQVPRPDLVALAVEQGLPDPRAVYAEGGWWVSTMTPTGKTGLYLVTPQGLQQVRVGGNGAKPTEETEYKQRRLL